MKYQLMEDWTDGLAEWGVSLDGSPNPEREHYVQCATKEDARRLVDYLDAMAVAGVEHEA